MSDYPDHEWRPEQYGMIRGEFFAAVSLSWCSETAARSWRWHVSRVEDCERLVDGDGLPSANAAMAAASKWMAENAGGNPYDFSWLNTNSPFASMSEAEARNWHIRRDERNGKHTP